MNRRRHLPQLLVLTAFVAVAVLFLVWVGVLSQVIGSSADRGPVAIKAALAQQMRVTLERLPPERHHHGGQVGTADEPSPLVCGTRVYGYDPVGAATVHEVVTVYGFHLCALAESGRSWDWSVKLVSPLVMRLDTEPPTLQIAQSSNGVSYRDRVKQLFPVRYRKPAFEQALGPAELAELRRRYEAVAGPSTIHEPSG